MEKKTAPLPPKKGDTVTIIIKPYHKKITKIGVVKDVLTKAKKPKRTSFTIIHHCRNRIKGVRLKRD